MEEFGDASKTGGTVDIGVDCKDRTGLTGPVVSGVDWVVEGVVRPPQHLAK